MLTGIGGEGWVEAARRIASERGFDIAAYVIGPDRDAIDLFGDWAALRETEETGCVLVRPDHHVAFRASAVAADAHRQLDDALMGVLGRSGQDGARAAAE